MHSQRYFDPQVEMMMNLPIQMRLKKYHAGVVAAKTAPFNLKKIDINARDPTYILFEVVDRVSGDICKWVLTHNRVEFRCNGEVRTINQNETPPEDILERLIDQFLSDDICLDEFNLRGIPSRWSSTKKIKTKFLFLCWDQTTRTNMESRNRFLGLLEKSALNEFSCSCDPIFYKDIFRSTFYEHTSLTITAVDYNFTDELIFNFTFVKRRSFNLFLGPSFTAKNIDKLARILADGFPDSLDVRIIHDSPIGLIEKLCDENGWLVTKTELGGFTAVCNSRTHTLVARDCSLYLNLKSEKIEPSRPTFKPGATSIRLKNNIVRYLPFQRRIELEEEMPWAMEYDCFVTSMIINADNNTMNIDGANFLLSIWSLPITFHLTKIKVQFLTIIGYPNWFPFISMDTIWKIKLDYSEKYPVDFFSSFDGLKELNSLIVTTRKCTENCEHLIAIAKNFIVLDEQNDESFRKNTKRIRNDRKNVMSSVSYSSIIDFNAVKATIAGHDLPVYSVENLVKAVVEYSEQNGTQIESLVLIGYHESILEFRSKSLIELELSHSEPYPVEFFEIFVELTSLESLTVNTRNSMIHGKQLITLAKNYYILDEQEDGPAVKVPRNE